MVNWISELADGLHKMLHCMFFFSVKYLAFHWKFQEEDVGLCERVFPYTYISYIRYTPISIKVASEKNDA